MTTNLVFERKFAIKSDSKNDTHNFFQFWREHIYGTQILHFPANIFREGFSNYGENMSSAQLLYLQNLRKMLVSLTLIWWGKSATPILNHENTSGI